ncbi:MAG: fumarate hydratase [Coprothermobacterota bacterium]|nr:fumarate hydratase [Coprothermobacterota bacterium]
MREVAVSLLRDAVRDLCLEANVVIPDDTLQALERALIEETSLRGRSILEEILANDRRARECRLPACQDTGLAIVFLELGQDVSLVGGDLCQAINEGVRQGYRRGYLRNSVSVDPLRRANSGDNTPAVLHLEVIPGDSLRLVLLPKGGGAENASALSMLTPASGWEGVRRFVLEQVCRVGPSACPPLVLGVGVGGSFGSCALLAKKALLRPLGRSHPDPQVAAWEDELKTAVNNLGIGPMGLGGHTTALSVAIEVAPCHIASLPVAVNLNCHSHRHRSVTL